jgi:hypothetical protein
MADIINQIDGQVQIIFEKGEGAETYRDALWMKKSEYESMSSETIESMKQQRYDNWLSIVNPTVIDTPVEDNSNTTP